MVAVVEKWRSGEENGFDGWERGRQVSCLEESGDLKKIVEEMGLVGCNEENGVWYG